MGEPAILPFDWADPFDLDRNGIAVLQEHRWRLRRADAMAAWPQGHAWARQVLSSLHVGTSCRAQSIIPGPKLPEGFIMITMTRPDRTEAAEYYFTYIDHVTGDADVREILDAQLPETLELLRGISEERSLHRYAPDKWSIREVVSHLNDTERLFVFRAFWFARGFDTPLPSFDQNVAVSTAAADARTLGSHIEEFQSVRAATLTFFQRLPDEAWTRRGTASGNPFTVHALAYITAGHVTHHTKILRERYL